MPRAICFVLSMYHDSTRVRGFVQRLRAIRKPADVEVHVVIADNGREPRTPSIPGAEVLRAPRNLGYLGGCVYAFETWQRRHGLPEWLVVTNSDIELAADFLQRLAGEAWPDDAGVAAPDIRLVNGARQNPLLWRRPSRTMMLTYAMLAQSRLFALSFEAGVRLRHDLRRITGWQPDGPSGHPAIYAPHGSVMLFHRVFFERGAKLEYGATMYGEEIHIAEQARLAGLRVIWRKDLHVVHDEHATMRSVTPKQRHRWLAESAAVLWHDYFAAGKT